MSDPTPPRDHRTVARLDELVEPDEFTRRHIGPSPVDLSVMLQVIDVDSVGALLDETMPVDDPLDRATRIARRSVRSCCARPASRHRRPQSKRDQPDRHGVHGDDHSPGHRPERVGEPCLVHGVHAVSARDQPGPTRSAAQLPDPDHRTDRSRCRQRLAARRGNGGCRSDDDGSTAIEVGVESFRRPPRHAPPDHRRAAHPRRAGRHRAGGWRRRRTPRWRRSLRGALQPADIIGSGARLGRGDRRGARPGRHGRGGNRPLGLPPHRPSRPDRRRHRHRLRPAIRRADGLRRATRGIPRCTRSCRTIDARTHRRVSASTPRVALRFGWRCRRANSTSGARRRRRTSAPPRCCSRTSPGSMPRGTDATA